MPKKSTLKHPGEVLREHLLEYCKAKRRKQLAAISNSSVSYSYFYKLMKGHVHFTATISKRLAQFFKTTPEYWMDLQARYEKSKAKSKLQKATRRKHVSTQRTARS